jgi:phage terminase large subunit GpA-like protein
MSEEVYRSTIAEGLFYVDGKPLSLSDYPMFRAIYDGKYSRLLLKSGRQVGKSTLLSSFMIAEAIAASPFKSFYISPSQEQTRKFSHTRIAKILAYSPDLRRSRPRPWLLG